MGGSGLRASELGLHNSYLVEVRSTQVESIAHEILEMARVDQEMRRALRDGGTYDRELDRRNADRMRWIVDEIGWPGASLVGEQAAHCAWLLVQHAGHDLVFMERCLALMKAMPSGEVRSSDIAYLEDRVAMFNGHPQRYGTQFRKRPDGGLEPYPIEDPDRLDERRAQVGLQPFGEYRELVERTQGSRG